MAEQTVARWFKRLRFHAHKREPVVSRELADRVYQAAIYWRDQARATRQIGLRDDDIADRKLTAYLDHRKHPPLRIVKEDEAA